MFNREPRCVNPHAKRSLLCTAAASMEIHDIAHLWSNSHLHLLGIEIPGHSFHSSELSTSRCGRVGQPYSFEIAEKRPPTNHPAFQPIHSKQRWSISFSAFVFHSRGSFVDTFFCFFLCLFHVICSYQDVHLFDQSFKQTIRIYHLCLVLLCFSLFLFFSQSRQLPYV